MSIKSKSTKHLIIKLTESQIKVLMNNTITESENLQNGKKIQSN